MCVSHVTVLRLAVKFFIHTLTVQYRELVEANSTALSAPPGVCKQGEFLTIRWIACILIF
jgi:hypothetical protein